jgi:hypothetical protein
MLQPVHAQREKARRLLDWDARIAARTDCLHKVMERSARGPGWQPVAKGKCRTSVTVTFFRAASCQQLTRTFVREKRLTVTRAQFHHGLLD